VGDSFCVPAQWSTAVRNVQEVGLIDFQTEVMRIGIGLPAAVPGVDATVIGTWAAASERAGFASVGVIDRLVYDNLDPLVALAAPTP
jgi:hypothetical protein